MKTLIQWSLDTPKNWEQIDSSQWTSTPKKPEPSGIETVDTNKGWVHGLNIQGVIFEADHYHVIDIVDGVRVTIWNDDPIDWPVGYRHARVWDIFNIQPDAKLNQALNTKQSQVVYAEQKVMPALNASAPLQNTTFEDWSNFVPPAELEVRHGIETDITLHNDHVSIRSQEGWRKWTEGLDPSEINNGQIKSQRDQGRFERPKGTRTYFASRTDLSNGIHVATFEKNASLTTTASQNQQVTIAATSDVLGWSYITPTNEPGAQVWPPGTYRFQLDVTVNNGSNEIGLLTLGGSNGHFARIDAGITTDVETKTQVESAFTGTGLKLATTGNVSWTTGNILDRFECLVAARNPAAHGGSQISTLQAAESYDFIDGPWFARGDDFTILMFGGL